MLPDPLHPAVVHFPIAIGILLPLFAVIALILVQRGANVRHVWIPVAVLGFVFLTSGWIALESGEDEEEVVENVVPEDPIERHEDSAERFMLLGAFGFALSVIGLARGKLGHWARVGATVALLAMPISAIGVGGSGGEIVYEHLLSKVIQSDATNAEFPGTRDDDD